MPLIGLNRAFVKQGLRILGGRSNIGLRVLSDVARVRDKPNAYHLGFMLGPRVNAGGRVGDAMLGSHLLSTHDELLARQIASRLDAYNEERQTLERYVLDQALDMIEDQKLNDHPVLLVGAEGWHPGVIGIVASRLKERFYKPSLVVGFDGANGKGSGRSITGVSMGDAMHKAVHLGLLEKGGGHAMAAGFSVNQKTYDAFYEFLNDELGPKAREAKPTIYIDSVISLSGINDSLLEQLSKMEPFGAGNPSVKFMIPNLKVSYMEPVGTGHRRCRIQDEKGASATMMAFAVENTAFEKALQKAKTKPFDVIVTVKENTYGGRKDISIIMEDMAL
jgi:single-stranded-DNA-specific exonuclease